MLKGNAHPLPASAQDRGEVDATLPLPNITMHFKPTAAQQAELDRLAEAQQDPSSPQYHKWLTPEQYADRFGLSAADVNRITAWLERSGFTNIQVARGRSFVTMSGTALQARVAFGTPIHHYAVDGALHYASAAEPSLPVELQGVVTGIRGLSDFHPQPHVRPRPRYTSSLTGNHFLAPGDFATIYGLQALYNSGINGAGQAIAIPGQTDVQIAFIEAFQAAAGLPIKDPQIFVTGVDPGTHAGDLSEASLDLEWSGAVARGASIIYVNSSDAFTSATYAIDQNVAPVVSLTYGGCEASFPRSYVLNMNSVFQQAAVMGITVVVASGDSGAADCDGGATATALAVDFPASSPYVTAIGGTEFNEGAGNYWSSTNGANGNSALSYIPEMVWNDTALDGQLSGSGGGASLIFSKPAWQTGTGVPADGVRDVPDISLAASVDHDGYLMCEPVDAQGLPSCTDGFRDSQTFFDVVGGTSAGAPTFAGIVAMINQATGGRQGLINPTLYTLAASNPAAFNDITVGDNKMPCGMNAVNCPFGTSIGYAAGVGYDQATGLGTINAYHLLTGWPGVTVGAPAAPTLSSPINGSTSVALTPTLTWEASSGASSYNVFLGTTSPPPLVSSQLAATSYTPSSLAASTTYYWSVTAVNSAGSASSGIWSFTTTSSSGGGSGGLFFVPVTPCRIADTRNADGAFGGPTMTAGSMRSFAIPQSTCGIPAGAQAYSLNVTVVPQGPLSYLTLWPDGQAQPLVSTLNSLGGAIVANAAIVPAGTNGAVDVFVTNDSDVILDINGYFAGAGGEAFYTVTPCRVADTRNPRGPLGGPSMSAGETRFVPVLSSSCGLPTSATAYSMNATVVPQGTLSYLTMWPFGQTQPLVSTLNSLSGKIVANAALVPAGALGDISVFVTNPTDVVLDTNGYFSGPGNTGALTFHPVTPCRVADTRNPDGPLGGPILDAGIVRSFNITASSCSIPSTAQAYSLNVTVVPSGPLSYLTVWPAGTTQPLVSTLNSFDGSIVANAAIVPAGTSGAIDVFATNPTHVILDINGYFAP